MPISILLRVIREPDNTVETLGKMYAYNSNNSLVMECESLELAYKNNQRGISCIPIGIYDCQKVGATKAIPYDHILILNTSPREGVCIHIANYVTQLRGCIAVGGQRAHIDKDGQLDVTSSGNTFRRLMACLPDKFKLDISQIKSNV